MPGPLEQERMFLKPEIEGTNRLRIAEKQYVRCYAFIRLHEKASNSLYLRKDGKSCEF